MSDRLVDLMKSAECSPLLDRLRTKLQRGESLTGRCRLSGLTQSQRQRIADLTGQASRGGSVTVDLETLAQVVINTGRFSSLRELVECASGGEIANLKANRVARSQAWDSVWIEAQEAMTSIVAAKDTSTSKTSLFSTPGSVRPLVSGDLHNALLRMKETGWLQRITQRDHSRATALLNRAFDVLKLLPVTPIPLAIFAAKQCGDAHALDHNQPLGRVVLRLLTPAERSDPEASKKKAVRRRRTWESAGLVPDELSSTALAINLPAVGESLCDMMLRNHRCKGMPVRLTFRHLRLETPTFPACDGSALYVCENPSILAAAAECFGESCPPMVCVEGHPSLTCWTLLRMLTASGFRIRYHGDFDWGGIRIANKIHEAFGFEPWLFSATDYQVRSGSHRKLKPPVATSVWDDALTPTILAAGVAVEQESVVDSLIADLQTKLVAPSGPVGELSPKTRHIE